MPTKHKDITKTANEVVKAGAARETNRIIVSGQKKISAIASTSTNAKTRSSFVSVSQRSAK